MGRATGFKINRRTVEGKITQVMPDETAAETARLARQNAAAASSSAAQARANFAAKDPRRTDVKGSNSENIHRKSPSLVVNDPYIDDPNQRPADESTDFGIPRYKVSGERNPLHGFRSFNYLFTLAAVKEGALKNPNSIRESADKYYVIAKSAGKGINAIQSTNGLSKNSKLIEQFNEKSAGRYDFYINNVEIDTLMTFTKTTNLAMGTRMSFEIYEPYSINGFLEALQVSSVAAGHVSYLGAPFVLKVEFVGYSDKDEGPSTNLMTVENSTRYFVINITKMDISVTEEGTRYKCQAIAHNETGYGDSNDLKTPVQIAGSNVGSILQNLMKAIENSEKEAAIKEGSSPDFYDRYEIIFPTRNGDKIDYATPNQEIMKAQVTEMLVAPNYAMPEPGPVLQDMYNNQNKPRFKFNRNDSNLNGKNQPKVDITQTSMQFTKGAKIHDIIASVVRDSSWGKRIFSEPPEKIIKNGMVDFVHVAIEVEILDGKWNPATRRPVYKYRYIVMPYKMHFTRIPLFQKLIPRSEMQTFVEKHVKRKYSYIYTGENVDILNFNITLNNLFYQAYSQSLGNQKIFSDPSGKKTKSNTVNRVLNPADESDEANRFLPESPRRADSKLSAVVKPGENAGPRDYQYLDAMVAGMHQAILDNTSMIKCDVEILGDPYFLVTGGIGNYRPILQDNAITTDGEAPYQSNDIVVVLEFRNPSDVSPTDGKFNFDKNKVPFSGCFRVIRAKNKFVDGKFTQRLELLRIPGQPYETIKSPPASSPSAQVGLLNPEAPPPPSEGEV